MTQIADAIRQSYNSVMSHRRNPLRGLDRTRRFQVMTLLSIMWTTIFSATFGAWFYFGELLIGHVLLLLGVIVTGVTFRVTEKKTGTYRNATREDGTPCYDDVWGA
ncbi:hypothetical protein [Sphingomicrobium clamense]|uniref:Uncharacterized protein n=1 Tax=Sphingomicrobium clamense TaxID=2851013 RepID=A0ABS6V6N8_9SPHN|nr:hypothetical protein [Sphingomicrobium sp. B8]MBW0145227.1 hypothetical protein [Sphingomicrobium sp. B8]